MKYNFIALLCFIFMESCNGQSKSLAENTVDLESFDFNTKIADLLPEKFKTDKNTYEIPGDYFSYTINRWPVYNNQSDKNEDIIGYHYDMSNYSNANPFAVFGKQAFGKIGIVSNLSNEIQLIAAEARMSEKESNDFIQKLTEKYGSCKMIKAQNFRDRDIYEWANNNILYRYAPVKTDNSNALRFNVDGSNTITEGKTASFTEGYFYTFSKDFEKEIKYLNTGIFVYIL